MFKYIAEYRNMAAIAAILFPWAGCCCPQVSHVDIVKSGPPAAVKTVEVDAAPVVWMDVAVGDSDQKRVKRVSPGPDVLELIFNNYVVKATTPAPPPPPPPPPPAPAPAAAVPSPIIDVMLSLFLPKNSPQRHLRVQIRGLLLRATDGQLILQSELDGPGNYPRVFTITNGQPRPANGMTAQILPPFSGASDTAQASFSLSYDQPMPSGSHFPLRLSLNAFAGPGNTSQIEITSVTITAVAAK